MTADPMLLFNAYKTALVRQARRRDVLGRRMNPRYRFPGIVTAARELGVSRIHLYYVLTGHRANKRLVQGYERIRDRVGSVS